MKKILTILISGLILSCNSKEKLEGTWVGAYSFSNTSDSNMNLPQRIVVTFEEDKYFAKSFKYDYRAETDFEKGTYEYRNDSIFYNSDNSNFAVIEILNKDSLVIKGMDGTNNTVYKRLEDSFKSKSDNIKLIDKRYLMTSKNHSDTLNFVNDSLLIKNSDNSGKPGTHWERFEHNGFDILFMEYNIPLIIRKEKNETIIFTGLHKNKYDFEFIELE